MPTYEIRTGTGKRYTVATVKADLKAGDSRAALRLLEDECDRRGLNPHTHVIREWSQRSGWIDHGGTK